MQKRRGSDMGAGFMEEEACHSTWATITKNQCSPLRFTVEILEFRVEMFILKFLVRGWGH